jgi:predicted transcriptional regulator
METDMLYNNGHRSKVEIIANILSLLRLGDAGPTEITSTAKTNREQTFRYLVILSEADLVETVKKENGTSIFGITKKGLDLLRRVENMREMLPPMNANDVLLRLWLIKLMISDKLSLELPE